MNLLTRAFLMENQKTRLIVSIGDAFMDVNYNESTSLYFLYILHNLPLAHPNWCDRSDVQRYCPSTCGQCSGGTLVNGQSFGCSDIDEQWCQAQPITCCQRLDTQSYCLKTCGKCTVVEESSTPTVTASTSTSNSICFDKDEQWCQVNHAYYSQLDSPWCERLDIQDYCPKTCLQCTGMTTTVTVQDCMDTYDQWCSDQAEFCDLPNFQYYCPKTCNRCPGISPSTTPTHSKTVPVCVDTDTQWCQGQPALPGVTEQIFKTIVQGLATSVSNLRRDWLLLQGRQPLNKFTLVVEYTIILNY
ncbi:hypothetical protein PoB_003107200 [Plakobranchus ocellatus]|uniref:ShKT domain-containing protein n=1 Tax=Plakobranchus ocellatus TaxID=259542 RepID=A0AAV4ABE1_9GAST|nr:hypothetical protein PoB_003107200 [Plakobranchus ocellatus]